MKKITIIAIIISILMPSIVFAASSFQIELAADKTSIKEGETITISLSLTDLNVTTGEQGIGAYLAKIEYDTKVFEKATFSGTTNWEGSMENGHITGVTIDGKVIKQTQTIATLSLTVKENAPLGNSTISISNFVGSDAVNDISTNKESIVIKVIEENQNQNNSNKNESNVDNTNTGSNETNNNNTNNNESDTNTDNNTNGTTDDNNVNNSDNNHNNNTNNNGNSGTTDTTINNQTSNEQETSEDNTMLYGTIIVVLLTLIIAAYIYYKKKKASQSKSEY